MSMMQFRMKQSRPITTCGTRQFDSSINHGTSKLMKQVTTPKMWKEKENLYDENIQLKQLLNQLRTEVQQTKLRNTQLEKELQRFESLLEEQVKSNNNNPNSCDMPRGASLEKYGLVVKLKNKQKALAQELLLKNKEVVDLKRSLKYTHIQELEVLIIQIEIELQNYRDESIRLRQQLDLVSQMVVLQQSGDQLEKRVIQQDKTLKILQKDNQDLQQNLVSLDQAAKQFRVKYEDAVRQNEKLMNDQISLIQTIDSLKEYIKQCNDMIEQQKKTQSHPIEEIKIEYLQQIEVLKQKGQDDIEQKNKEIRDLTSELYKQTLHVQELERLLEQQEEFLKDRQSLSYSPHYLQKSDTPEVKTKPFALDIKPTIVKKRLPKVQYFEVKAAALRLKIQLFKAQVPYEELDELFSEEDLSIAQVREILRKAPFELQDRNQLNLLSRYLVEDNQEDFVIFDENRRNSSSIIKSVLRRLVGKYTLFSPNEEKAVIESIKKKLNATVTETIQMIVAKKKDLEAGTCETTDWEQALKFHEISLTQRESEKLQMISFELSQSLEVVNYQATIKYFA